MAQYFVHLKIYFSSLKHEFIFILCHLVGIYGIILKITVRNYLPH